MCNQSFSKSCIRNTLFVMLILTLFLHVAHPEMVAPFFVFLKERTGIDAACVLNDLLGQKEPDPPAVETAAVD